MVWQPDHSIDNKWKEQKTMMVVKVLGQLRTIMEMKKKKKNEKNRRVDTLIHSKVSSETKEMEM